MSYSVQSVEVFERQAKRLVKKYASLKNELKEVAQKLAEYPQLALLWAITVSKSVLLSPRKAKANQAADESLPISQSEMLLFTCSPYTINRKKKI
jgi:hypothetical protein